MKVTQENSFLEGWGLLLFSKLVLTLSPVFICNSFSVPYHPSEDTGSKVFARTLSGQYASMCSGVEIWEISFL